MKRKKIVFKTKRNGKGFIELKLKNKAFFIQNMKQNIKW